MIIRLKSSVIFALDARAIEFFQQTDNDMRTIAYSKENLKTLKFLSSTLPAHSLDKNKSFLDVVVIVSVVDVIVAVVGLVFVVVLKKCNLLDDSQL